MNARWIAAAVAACALPCIVGAQPHWSYHGKTGAAQWGKLESDFATCEMGQEQSPINITRAVPATV